MDAGLGWPRSISYSSPLCFPGGADKNVIVFDKSSEQILATLKGHSKKVTSVVFHPSQVRCCMLWPLPSRPDLPRSGTLCLSLTSSCL